MTFTLVLRGFDGPIKINKLPYPNLVEAIKEQPTAALIFLFPVVGIFLAYKTLLLWVNHTRLEVRNSKLERRYGPLPWWHQRLSFSSAEIERFEIDEISGRHGSVSYQVLLVDKRGRKHAVDLRDHHGADAQFLKEWLDAKFFF